MRPKKTYRARGTGSVYQRADGRWCAQVDTGRLNQQGRRIRHLVYGWSQAEVTAKLDADAIPAPRKQKPRGYPCTTCKRTFHPDDLFLERCGACFPWGQAVRGLNNRWREKPAEWVAFTCPCGDERVSRIRQDICFQCELDGRGREEWRLREARMEAARLIGTHTEAEWLGLCEAHGNRCTYCGAAERLTKDHVVPIARGGSDLIENIAPACWDCNKRKGPRSVAQFRDRLHSASAT